MSQKHAYNGHRARLRERFAAAGIDALADHEVLELLLTYCIARKDTKPIAWALVKRFGSLRGVLDAKAEELREIAGLGAQSAQFLNLQRALIRRYFLERAKENKKIESPADIIDFCRASLHGLSEEIFEVIFLTARNDFIDAERIASGSLQNADISPRKIIERALSRRAAGLIFVHNHPSGEPSPSNADIEITKTLSRLAAQLGIKVLDHIIIGQGKIFSIKENGLISGDVK
ncbi:MAG: DNA repair protein RadC [Elusimicrobiota bacterium]|jgi:DNA repair protein RadC|nr:DNA repair protein RadC [Elusimicrobiota bacterium]